MTDPATEQLHFTLVAVKGCWHVHPKTLAPLPEGEWECRDLAARLADAGYTIAPTSQAEAGVALERLGRLRSLTMHVERTLDRDQWTVTMRWWPADGRPPHHPIDRTGTGPTTAFAIAAALGDG